MSGLSQSISGIEAGTGKCEQCGATTHLHDGMCVSCFLKEGLAGEQQDSIADFESVLAEADVPDKEWRLGNYEIIEEIGRGGMGVIYRARQRHSRRVVALKRMLTYHADSHETLTRFRREAEAAASLDHPNILPIYEVNESEDGLPFFSMKLATAGSLRTAGPELRNSPRECVQLIAKVSRAIDYAHQHGILHRDLQPGNVLLDARGEPLVSDFGLAKWLDQESDLTRTLTSLGTPGFIAPEQAEGISFSPAADIYSLGALLFNLLVGRPPFVGNNALSVIRQAAAKPAPKLRFVARSFDRDLETIVARCLERDPKARYKTAGTLADDLERWLEGKPIAARPVLVTTELWRWSRRNPVLSAAIAVCLLLAAAVAWLIPKYPQPSSHPPEKSIAILPFQNLSKDHKSAFLSDGVQEEILSRLSKVEALKVISHTSTERFAGASKDTRKIGQALGVAHVLQGSVQSVAGQVRVTVQLIDAGNAKQIWAETYDRNLRDIFQVESEIASNIARKLEANLTQREAQAVAVRPTTNAEAHELYLKGRYFWNKRNPDGFRKALGFFTQATQLDPNYAPAFVGIADTYGVMPTYDLCSAKECFPLAKAAALTALKLDDGLAEAHTSYGGLLASEYKWGEARRHLERAIGLDPNYAIAHEVLGLEVLMNLGEVSRGLAELRRAQELDPLSLIVNTLVGLAHYRLHEYDQTRTELRKALELDPNFYFAREVLAQTFDMEDRFDEAISECQKALEKTDAPGILATLGHAYARAGNRDAALKVLEQLQQQSQKRVVTAVNFAWIYIALGEKDEAMNWLEKAYDDGSLYGIKLDPFLDPLRDEPRFQQLVARVFPKGETAPAAIAIPEKSIAVLPFENLSEEKQNAYFTEGIHDEILTHLAKVADLKVISRTSTQSYQSKPRNLAEIARQLGVANILEGSVQKSADQVRVNVQLINAQTDSPLWAETYDRKLTDIFAVESEIAKRIVATLRVKLTGREEEALAAKPTNNPEAYDAYLRGLAFEAHGLAAAPASINLVSKAAGFYERAVQLDPNFAIAWARLSRADAMLYFNRNIINSAARGDAAKRVLENAQKLEPDSSETLLALGYYQYWVLRDYEAAKATFGRVSKMLPGTSEVPAALGRITRREGHWDQSIAHFGNALSLDPRNTVLLFDAASSYAMVRQFPAALKLYDRALDITPNDPDMMAAKAEIYQAQGNLEEAARFLSEVNERTSSEDIFLTKINLLRLERNYGEAIRLLQARLAHFHFASQFDRIRDQVSLAWLQRFAGDMAGAKVTAEQTRNALEQLNRDQPDNYYFLLWLSQAYAALEEKDSALKAAEHAITLLPSAKDAVEGPDLEENQALIQTIAGDNSRAISTLTQLLQTPYARWVTAKPPITPALLRLDPFWDPLRGDPRFEKIVSSLMPSERTN